MTDQIERDPASPVPPPDAPARRGKLGRKAAGGAAMTLASQGIRMVLRMVQVVILARMLEPEDLGLVAAVSPIVGLAVMFQNVGLQQAVVQRQGITEAEINRVFWVLTLVGLVSMSIIMGLSPLIAAFYGDPRMQGIAIAAAPALLLTSASSVPAALLSRQMEFRWLSIIDICITLAMLFASTTAALVGLGFWALLIGDNAGALVRFLFSWRKLEWRPSRPDFRLEGHFIRFGVNLTGSNFLNYLTRNIDNVLIAKFAGPVQLGFYDRGYKLLLFPVRNGVQPLNRVTIPMLSRVQHDPERFRRTYVRVVSLLMLAIVPATLAMTAAPRDFILVFFGEKWLPVVPIFAFLGIVAAIQPQMLTASWVFVSLARTDQQLKLTFRYSVVVIAGFCIGVQWGAMGVAASYALTNLAMLPYRWWFLQRCSSVTVADNFAILGPFVVAAIPVWLMMHYLPAFAPLHPAIRCGLALVLCYAFSLSFAAFVPSTREALGFLFQTLRKRQHRARPA